MNREKNKITRRDLLRLALISPLATVAVVPCISALAQSGKINRLDKPVFVNAPGKIIPVDNAADISKLKLNRGWQGAICRSSLVNNGQNPVRVKEIVLFDILHDLPPETRFYGEGFQMLSQTGGTLGTPEDLSGLTDAKHYKMPIPPDARACYGMMTLAYQDVHSLLAFTSCRRFNGQFFLRNSSLQIVLDLEGLEIKPGETWKLEEFTFQTGKTSAVLLDGLAKRLNENHPPLEFAAPPTGWCSWYCFGPRVTAQQVLDNLDFIAKNAPDLKYVQIDDGYQPAMGDWLETGTAFGGDVRGVLKQIRVRGFEPAIWVAPFIAEEKSNIFQQHPEWFVKDADGKPLRSDKVTFGGWRSIKEKGAWYVLDGTHAEVQKHLENVFRTMKNEWGITYFKLDANFWGAIHGGRFNDQTATRIEAYRRGMKAILKGAGTSFILGCNHPIWASLGLIHGSRSSNDIKRTWDKFKTTGRQNLNRNWQNGRLWWNDPDAVCLMGEQPPEEFQFHATVIFASGGMVLSGDDLTKISSERLAMLKKLVPPAHLAANFDDDSLRVGTVDQKDARTVCLFNWEDAPQTISFNLPKKSTVRDYWSGEDFGTRSGVFEVENMPPHSARLLVCRSESRQKVGKTSC
jgi:alpha-galactosidase